MRTEARKSAGPVAWAALVGLIVLPALLQGTLKAYGSRSTPDAVLRGEKASVEALLFSGNGGALAAGDSGGNLTVWNVVGRSKRGSKSVKGEVLSLSLHPYLPAYFATTPKTLVIGGFQPGFESRLKENEVSIKVIYWFWSQNMEYQVQVVDWGNASVSRRSNDASFEISSKMKVNRSIAISADSQTLICRFDNRMSEFDLDSGRIIRDLDFGEPVPALQFAPDGRLFGAYGFTDGKVDAAYGWFDPALKTLRKVGRRLPIPVNKLSLSAKGDRLAVAGHVGFIRVYDTVTEKELYRFNARGPIKALALSSDGQTLACSGSADGSIRLWDLSKHKPN